MATSGSYDFAITRDQIITDAMHKYNALGIGSSPTANELTLFSRDLNRVVKGLQARGIGMWLNKAVAIVPQYQYKYIDLGTTGGVASICCLRDNLIATQISTAAASGASSIVVDSATGVSDTDYIFVELDDGTLQATTVDGDPVGTTITLAASLTDDVAVDNMVYSYATSHQLQRPLEILECNVYNHTSDIETPVEIVSRETYRTLANKATDGQINQVFYDPQLTNGRLYVWPRSDNVEKYLVATVKYPIEDFDAAENNPDFPIEWANYLVYSTAASIGDALGADLNRIGRMEQKAEIELMRLMALDTDQGSVFFQPDFEGCYGY